MATENEPDKRGWKDMFPQGKWKKSEGETCGCPGEWRKNRKNINSAECEEYSLARESRWFKVFE